MTDKLTQKELSRVVLEAIQKHICGDDPMKPIERKTADAMLTGIASAVVSII